MHNFSLFVIVETVDCRELAVKRFMLGCLFLAEPTAPMFTLPLNFMQPIQVIVVAFIAFVFGVFLHDFHNKLVASFKQGEGRPVPFP